jgi:hypothetical protein
MSSQGAILTRLLPLGAPLRRAQEKVAFPEGFEKGTLYATVDRHDIKQFRELYASPGVVEAVRKGQPVPSGAVLTRCSTGPRSTTKHPVAIRRPFRETRCLRTQSWKTRGWGRNIQPTFATNGNTSVRRTRRSTRR